MRRAYAQDQANDIWGFGGKKEAVFTHPFTAAPSYRKSQYNVNSNHWSVHTGKRTKQPLKLASGGQRTIDDLSFKPCSFRYQQESKRAYNQCAGRALSSLTQRKANDKLWLEIQSGSMTP